MTHTQTTYINRIALRAVKKGTRPAKVGALFEKSATELKQQKLLKCKQTIQIATFKVKTLNRMGQLPELTASAVEHKIDIICIQEHRYTHTEDIKYHDTGNGLTLATVSAWKNSVNATVGGVGMLIGPKALKTLSSIERIQPKMMAATFNGNPRAAIISCYSPTNVSEETERSEEETTQKLPRWGQKVCNKWKINSQIKKPHLKMIPIKDNSILFV